jgi:flagellar biosynthesis/type III secretory pathway chaperone
MELENHTSRQTYIQLLADTLKKKREVLNLLMNITQKQESVITSEPFREEQFLQIITLKEEHIQNLAKLDTGFEQLYNSVKEELVNNKNKYSAEIAVLKDLITDITDFSVRLQAMEKRNKSKLEVLFASKRKEIKMSRMSNQKAANYYKTMANQQESQSYFYDKKK